MSLSRGTIDENDLGSVHLMSDGLRSRNPSVDLPNGFVNPYSDAAVSSQDLLEPKVDENCGCGSFRPSSFARFNNSKCLLFWLCMAALTQALLVNGLVSVVITTIERRYSLSSTESGVIASCYDIASLIFLLPVSYFGGAGQRPKWLAIGLALVGIGSLLFSVPHFLSDVYRDTQNITNLCVIGNGTVVDASKPDCLSPISRFKYFFIVAQLLHGAGSAPLYTLGVSLLDDSVKPKLSSLYVGIYYAFSMLGPAFGYLLGGQFLKLYIDFDRVDSWSLTEDSLAWLGAWWIGFLGAGSLAILISIPLFMFPAVLPHTEEYKSQRLNETHSDVLGTEATHPGFGGKISDLPKAIKLLLINRTFVFLNFAAGADAFLVMGIATYGPKIIQSQFGFTASAASVIMGAATIPMGAGGTLLGGYIVKRFKLTCANIMKFCTVCSFLALMCILVFLLRCPDEKFAGINVSYNGTGKLESPSILNSCNADCNCPEDRYDPVCSVAGNVMFLTPCHAGCVGNANDSMGNDFYTCSCIGVGVSTNASMPVAKRTSCSTDCSSYHYVFISVFALVILFTFLSSIPAISATLRCVTESQRPFSMGVQWIMVRALGSVPGPLVFGAVIDTVCTYWQKEACGNGDAGRCISYNNTGLSNSLFAIAIVWKTACTLCFFLSWWFYKSPEQKVEELRENIKISD